MKKISKLAGIIAAAALLCGISGCDNTETITFTSASIEMVGDPVKTDKAVVFQWKDSVANNVLVTRQAPGEEEVTLRTPYNEEGSLNWFADRVSYENQLKAGVEYTYRFYNISDVSSARTTEYTLEKKFSCVERKVTFDSIAAAGTKLAPITKEQVTIVKSEAKSVNYVSVYVNEKEATAWITIYDKTGGYKLSEDEYSKGADGSELKDIRYNPSHDYEILVGKWWPGKSDNENRYYSNADTEIKFDLPATSKNDISRFFIDLTSDSFEVVWDGKKGSTYEVSFEAFDNKDNAVALKKSTVDASAIKHDDFFTYKATGKVSAITDISKPTSIKIIKVIVKETVDGKIVSESDGKIYIPAASTTYTQLSGYDYDYDDNRNHHISDLYIFRYVDSNNKKYLAVQLSGANLPETAKLYYKLSYSEQLYTEFKGDFKKAAFGNYFEAIFAEDALTEGAYYDFKAVVTVDNAKWYDWEEGKTEEVAKNYEYQVNLEY